MKFMIFVKSNPGLEKSIDAMSAADMKESMAKMEAFNGELKKAGILKDCDGLRPSREGKRVRFDGQSLFERRDGNALIVPVHALQVFVRQRERPPASVR